MLALAKVPLPDPRSRAVSEKREINRGLDQASASDEAVFASDHPSATLVRMYTSGY
jgi:hypothetical protein